MLFQQTQAERVGAFLQAFFQAYGSIAVIAGADPRDLASALQPLGLHNRRAARIQALAQELLRRGGVVPATREDLESLPGVGPYVSAAYFSVAHGVPEPCVDVNMARVVERIYGPRRLVDIRHDPHINRVARRLISLADNPSAFNWAVLDLGALHCKARQPACGGCPLSKLCPTATAQEPG